MILALYKPDNLLCSKPVTENLRDMMREVLRMHYEEEEDSIVKVLESRYTGSQLSNLKLHEQDGRLSLIPWDYNLALSALNLSFPPRSKYA